MFEYFDIHSHLYFPEYDKDREEEIEKMKKEKIGSILVSTGFDSAKQILKLTEKHGNLFACIGQHPEELNKDSVFDERIVDLDDQKKVVSIGECGLDYFRMSADDLNMKRIQKTVFEYHIDLAISKDLPLMLHIRSSKGTQDAYLDTLEILEHHSKIVGSKLRGNAHFFAGDLSILKRLLSIGFSVSFTGVITFTSNYDELIKFTPLDMIMSETDAPFVAPVPYRGKRNSSLYVPYIVKRIAEIKEEPPEKVKKAMIDNVLKRFPLVADGGPLW